MAAFLVGEFRQHTFILRVNDVTMKQMLDGAGSWVLWVVLHVVVDSATREV